MPPLRPARPAPAQRNQASESILELKTGHKRNKGSKRIDVRESQLLSVPNTKRTPYMRGSYTLPEFVLKNQGYSYSIWRNDFGAKNGAQAKQRVEAYLTYARVFVIAQQPVFSPKAFAKSKDYFIRSVARL